MSVKQGSKPLGKIEQMKNTIAPRKSQVKDVWKGRTSIRQFIDVGQFDMLEELRRIKEISQQEGGLSDEEGDKLWRSADRCMLILIGLNESPELQSSAH